MKKTAFAFTCFLVLALGAAGKNLLLNPEFKGVPGNLGAWNQNPGVFNGGAKLLKGAGPGGKNAIALDLSKCARFHQEPITLAGGEKYRIGAWIRTKNLKSSFKYFGILVYNSGWHQSVSTKNFPADTNGKWIRWERVVTLPSSKDKTYTFSIYAAAAQGELAFCDPYLIPLSEKGIRESAPLKRWEEGVKRVVPYYPLLNQISAEKGEIGFCVVNPVDADFRNYVCRVSYAQSKGKKSLMTKEFPFDVHGVTRALLGKLPAGKGWIKAEMVRKKDKKVLYASEYPMTAVKSFKVKNARELNNFVTLLVKKELAGDNTFTAPADSWYRIAFSKALPGAAVSLDGKKILMNDSSETMRYLKRGTHTLNVKRSGKAAEKVMLTISKVPVLPWYPVFPNTEGPAIPGNKNREFKYDEAFCRRYLWNNFNTFVAQGAMSAKWEQRLRKIFAERGAECFGTNGFGKAVWNDPGMMEQNIRKLPHVRNTDGRTLDEMWPTSSNDVQIAVGELGWRLQDYEKQIHVWHGTYDSKSFNRPMIHRIHLAGVGNMSQGRGKALLETYAAVSPDESFMQKQFKRYVEQMRTLAYIPDGTARMIHFMGGYFVPYGYSIDCYPESDPKYFFDRFYQLMATDPAFKGIGGAGAYAMHHSDEEMVRFISALTRHYCIEGNTGLYTKKFNWSLNPGHLKNGGFTAGLKHWNVQSAAKDSVKAVTIKGAGRSKLGRRTRDIPGNGDDFVQFTAAAGKENRLSQKITGLTPGKFYSLTWFSIDPVELTSPRGKRTPFVLNALLTGAEVQKKGSYTVHPTPNQFRRNRKTRDFTVNKTVFKALNSEVMLTFSDKGAAPGAQRLVNFVAVRPYFSEAMQK